MERTLMTLVDSLVDIIIHPHIPQSIQHQHHPNANFTHNLQDIKIIQSINLHLLTSPLSTPVHLNLTLEVLQLLLFLRDPLHRQEQARAQRPHQHHQLLHHLGLLDHPLKPIILQRNNPHPLRGIELQGYVFCAFLRELQCVKVGQGMVGLPALHHRLPGILPEVLYPRQVVLLLVLLQGLKLAQLGPTDHHQGNEQLRSQLGPHALDQAGEVGLEVVILPQHLIQVILIFLNNMLILLNQSMHWLIFRVGVCLFQIDILLKEKIFYVFATNCILEIFHQGSLHNLRVVPVDDCIEGGIERIGLSLEGFHGGFGLVETPYSGDTVVVLEIGGDDLEFVVWEGLILGRLVLWEGFVRVHDLTIIT